MRAEEEIVPKAVKRFPRVGALQLVWRQKIVRSGKQRVRQQVPQKQRREESRPAHIDQVEVRMEVPPGSADAANVEAAVLIDNPPQRPVESLGEAGIETRFLHIYR